MRVCEIANNLLSRHPRTLRSASSSFVRYYSLQLLPARSVSASLVWKNAGMTLGVGSLSVCLSQYMPYVSTV